MWEGCYWVDVSKWESTIRILSINWSDGRSAHTGAFVLFTIWHDNTQQAVFTVKNSL